MNNIRAQAYQDPYTSDRTSILRRLWYIAMLFLITSIPPAIFFLISWIFWFRGDAQVCLMVAFYLNLLLMLYEIPFFWVGLCFIVMARQFRFGDIFNDIDKKNRAFNYGRVMYGCSCRRW
jgi:hypothetical protein